MQRCLRVLSEFYDPSSPWSLVMGGNVHPIPETEGVRAPFREVRIFTSLVEFGESLDAGLGRPRDTAV